MDMFVLLMSLMFRRIICLLFIFQGFLLWGQDLVYDQFTVEDGLPSSQVYETFEDDQGYLWLLTDKGLARYDGYRFTTFTKEDGLTDNVFYEFYQGSDGDIWLLGANNTITQIQTYPLEFIPYRFNDKLQNQCANIPNQFLIDEKGTLYISYLSNAGFVKINHEGKVENNLTWFSKKTFADSASVEAQLVDDKFCYFGLVAPEKKTSLVPSSYLVAVLNPLTGDIVEISENQQIKIIREDGAYEIETDLKPIGLGLFSDSTFWVSFPQNGLMVFNYKGERKSHLLRNQTVCDFFIDRENNYWISTLNSGVFHSRNATIKRLDLPKGFTSSITSLCLNRAGDLFFTTFEGQVGKIEPDSISLVFGSKNYEKVLITCSQFDGGLYFSHKNHVKNSNNETAVTTHSTSGGYDIAVLKNKVLMCTYWNFIEHYFSGESKSVKLDIKPRSIALTEHSILLGTNEGILYRTIADTTAEFQCLDSARKNNYRDLVNFKGYLFAANYGVGVDIYKNEEFLHSIKSAELASGFINKLYVDNQENLWVCTDNGINRITFSADHRGYRIRSLSYEDGLISNEVNDIVLKDGVVWLATRNGICYFNEAEVFAKKEKGAKYHLNINSFTVNDQIRTIEDQTFSHFENRVAIQFSGISFIANNKLEYRYRLNGAETNWNYTINTEAVYPKLASGKYEFVVQTKGENKSWSLEEASFKFEILPPYWKTWWFYTIVAGAILLLIYLFFRFRILLYNSDLVREILRQIMKKLKGETGYIVVKESGKEVKILSSSIYYVKSDGNYLEIHHSKGKTVIREKIGNFLDLVPDPLEYLRVRRSFIIRIDQVDQKGKKEVIIKGETIQVGKTYLEELDKIQL